MLLGELRQVIREVIKRSDAEHVASFRNAANGRVNATVDDVGSSLNIFVKPLDVAQAEELETVLVDKAQSLGWSLLSRSDRRGVTWWFEPDPETKGQISIDRLPSKLYHVTPTENVPDILQRGLEPRRRSVAGTTRRYSPRVYFATSSSTAKSMSKKDITTDLTLLQVDIKKANVPFYVDQEFSGKRGGMPGAVYAIEHIPADAITLA